MANHSTGGSHSDEANRLNKIKGIIAIVIILVCGGYLAWLLRPTPKVVFPEPQDPASLWIKAFNANSQEHAAKLDDIYRLYARIGTQPTEDKQGVVIEGTLANATDLATLKAEIATIQPQVPLEWKITFAR